MANNVYENNSLQLTLNTNADVTGANTTVIKYKDPDGTTGSWVASVVDSTKLRTDIDDADLTPAGAWTVKSFVSYASGEQYQGDPITLEVRRKWHLGA